jgi:hypothetical protein
MLPHSDDAYVDPDMRDSLSELAARVGELLQADCAFVIAVNPKHPAIGKGAVVLIMRAAKLAAKDHLEAMMILTGQTLLQRAKEESQPADSYS